MERISFSRFLLYAAAAACLPIVLVLFYFFNQKSAINQLQEHVEYLQSRVELVQIKQASNQHVIAHFADADRHYLEKHLESRLLLEPELQSIEALIDGGLPVSDPLKKRFEFLSTDQNRLLFTEGDPVIFSNIQETQEQLLHPVQINVSDLLKILSLIEGVELDKTTIPPNRPQLIITDFKIEKKEPLPKNEVYQLNLKLLKREFL